MIKRRMMKKLINGLNNFRIVMLNGPRQSGKSTLVKKLAHDRNMSYLSLDEPDKLELAQTDPYSFLQFYAQKPIVIDEIQFAPQLIPYIKLMVDEKNSKGLFLLTGSADFMKMRQITESLAGRMVRYNLFPLARSEITKKDNNIIDSLFDDTFKKLPSYGTFDDILTATVIGGYPEIINFERSLRNDWFSSYINARVQKDILELKKVSLSKLRIIKSLLRLLASYDGQLLNYNNLAKKLQISNKSALAYVELLEAMYIIKTLPSYHVNASLRVIKSAKIQFIDTGLACYLLNLDKENLFLYKDNKYGSLIENFVYSELLKESTYSDNKVEIHHFRDMRKKEVDLVLEASDGSIIGIEVKAKASINKKDLTGMLQLATNSKEKFKNGLIFYAGNEIRPISIEGHLFYCLPLAVLN